MPLTYEEALRKVKMQLATASDQKAVESAVKLTAWLLELMDDGYKMALVKGTIVKGIQIRVDQSTFTID